MQPHFQDVLLAIAADEPLEKTLQKFPSLTRQQLGAMLRDLARTLPRSTSMPETTTRHQHTDAIKLYTDGAARGNPGPAGAGIYITDATDRVLIEKSVSLGETTNNVAEYRALIIGLELALQFSPQRLLVQMDSELIVRQLSGRYRVVSPHLLPLFRRARELLDSFKETRVVHIPRKKNRQADHLSNQAIDQQ